MRRRFVRAGEPFGADAVGEAESTSAVCVGEASTSALCDVHADRGTNRRRGGCWFSHASGSHHRPNFPIAMSAVSMRKPNAS
jgi:hypothetical protein